MNKTSVIVGNEHDMTAWIRAFLVDEGVDVATFLREETWLDSLPIIQSTHPDMVILDMARLDSSSFEICREIRSLYDEMMVVILNQEDELSQTLIFELGADDVITRPFSHRVVQARIRAHMRRCERMKKKDFLKCITIRDLTVNAGRREVYLRGDCLDLTTLLFDLLWYLVKNAGSIVTRDSLCRAVFNSEYNGVDRSIDVYISRLRRKIEDDPTRPNYLKTVRGEGYLFAAG